MKTRWFHKACGLALTCLMLTVVIAGCGLKGAPVPDYSRDGFAFASLEARISAGGAVTFKGELTGAAQNLEYMVLEMQPVDGELCEGCPFLPQDTCRIDAREAWDGSSAASFSFVYRPAFAASEYRWRLIGHNVYSGLPDVTSQMQVLASGGILGNGIPPVPGIPQTGE